MSFDNIPTIITRTLSLLLLLSPILLAAVLKVKCPNKMWIGLTLSFMSPLGHLYLDGGTLWIIALVMFNAFSHSLVGSFAYSLLLTGLLSTMFMYYRLQKNTKHYT